MISFTTTFIILLLCVLISWNYGSSINHGKQLHFPLQFTGNLEITAHLIDESSTYPPRKRRMSIAYDYKNKRARAEIEAGYESAKIYIRRYDTKQEYMVRLFPIDDCKRSHLIDEMPFPEIPNDSIEYKGKVTIDGIECDYFTHTEFDTVLHIYMTTIKVHQETDDGELEETEYPIPVRLVQESIDLDEKTSQLMLTYDFTDVVVGEELDESLFLLPEPYSHQSCVQHSGGFPYLHIFHHFVRF